MATPTVAETAPISLDDARRWNILQHRLQQIRTAKAVRLFRAHRIEPIVIKGIAAARYYPEGEYRLSIDVDLAVSRDDFSRAVELVDSSDAIGLAIDVHRELRHLDTLTWDDLCKHSFEISLEDSQVRVLRPEDDLRVICVHWLTNGGADGDRLWDVYYAVDRRPADFDWERFLGCVSPRRQRWLECTLGLAAKYLGLDLTGTPVEGAEQRLPPWLVRTVEKEWAVEVKPWPLEASLHDRKMLFAQMKRRLRPNSIYATVDCEGSFDARTRLFYQIRNGLRRVFPSYRRIRTVLALRNK